MPRIPDLPQKPISPAVFAAMEAKRPKKIIEEPVPHETEPVVEAEPTYSITLNLAGQISEGKGTSMFEALRNLQKPVKITTKATLRIEHDGKSKEVYYTPNKLKRVFYPASHQILAKTFALALK